MLQEKITNSSKKEKFINGHNLSQSNTPKSQLYMGKIKVILDEEIATELLEYVTMEEEHMIQNMMMRVMNQEYESLL